MLGIVPVDLSEVAAHERALLYHATEALRVAASQPAGKSGGGGGRWVSQLWDSGRN